MLGNDVVDLRDPESDPESFRPRFDERVFAEEERREIAHDPRPLARRWAHWAAKEAAYKLARRLDPGFVFSPRTLVARFDPLSEAATRGPGVVERRGRLELPRTVGPEISTLELRSTESAACVHVVALPGGFDWGAVDVGVARIDPAREDAGRVARALAITDVARSQGVAAERLAIAKVGRVPVVELDGERTSLVLSLSHHGAWVAFACAPGPARTGRVRGEAAAERTPGVASSGGWRPVRDGPRKDAAGGRRAAPDWRTSTGGTA
ncbi:MAG: 4'-phosphopantetheinyl transferase superfamily protein [Myxococcales bacterium]|nr:4'-phosphopantetheinyl transferase superfamily protein [Myxococcales bacterium]